MSCRSAEKHASGSRRRFRYLLAFLYLIPLCLWGQAANANPVVEDDYRLYENVVYGASLGETGKNLLDIYLPKKKVKKRPVVVWVHGGGWYQGNKKSAAVEKAKVFVRRGFVFAAVNYRLSPLVRGGMSFPADRVRHPASTFDAARAVAWLSANVGRYGGDGRQMILMGHSAGGQVVSLLGTDPRFLRQAGMRSEYLRGVIALDPVGTDLARLANAPDEPDEDLKVTYKKMVWNAFAAPWEPDFDAKVYNGSPINHADRRDRPILMVTSSKSENRTREGMTMARLLGQVPALGTWNVNLIHRDINHRFGLGNSDAGTSRRALRFASWVTSGRSAEVKVTGRKVYRLQRMTGRAEVNLRLNLFPRNLGGRCRINRSVVFRCRYANRFFLGQGVHRFTARAIDPTGRIGRPTVFRFRVLPGKP